MYVCNIPVKFFTHCEKIKKKIGWEAEPFGRGRGFSLHPPSLPSPG